MIKNIANKGKVFLVGVGPGDERLITMAALDCMSSADVVIYDHLVNKSLLSYSRPNAKLIYAGKSPRKHILSQQNINKLLVNYAEKNKIVVRLKGGDPFLFARGSEEAVALTRAKVSYEIVPGVNSGSAAAAFAGIPLTHRGVSSLVTFVTGHEDPRKKHSDVDWVRLAKLKGTLVVFMGMAQLELITDKLIAYGMKKNTPAAIVQSGTLPSQKTVTGTVFNIAEKANSSKITSPAIIIIGKVVNFRKIINWFETKPLFGKKILITRPFDLARQFSQKLEHLGAQTFIYPLIEIVPNPKLDSGQILKKIKKSDWVIFTSPSAVNICFDVLSKDNKDARSFSKVKIAVLGPQTESVLLGKGIIADLIPKEFIMESLIAAFKKINIKGKRIFIPHSKQGRDVLSTHLRKFGAIVEEMFIYDLKRPRRIKRTVLKKMFKGEHFDVITFTSSSCVYQFMELIGREKNLLNKQTFAVIGPITEKTLKAYGYKAGIIAKIYTIDGLVEEIKRSEG